MFLGLELSDAGIMVAGGRSSRLLAVDGKNDASPGFALAEKKRIITGRQARRRAHLSPNQTQHRFWDQLDTAPLTTFHPLAANHAEVAFSHLAMIWERVKTHGAQAIIAVPGYFTRTQLGILLGMAQELAMPVKGFVTQAVAAAPRPYPGRRLLYLDIHLHRTELTLLDQGERLAHDTTTTMDEMGLLDLHRLWVEALAEEFVRTTRFDPLHSARGEQELYDRLAQLLPRLHAGAEIPLELHDGRSLRRINLTREKLAAKAALFVEQLELRIGSLLRQNSSETASATLLLSHRIAALPGIGELISARAHLESVALEAGASAINVLQNLHQYDGQAEGEGAVFFNSRPWALAPAPPGIRQNATAVENRERYDTPRDAPEPNVPEPATHLLVADLAYPITPSPLYVDLGEPSAGQPVLVHRRPDSAGRQGFALFREGGKIVLTVSGNTAVRAGGFPVEGRMTLRRPLEILVGTPPQTVRLITCLKSHET